MNIQSYRSALLIYSVLFCLFTFQYWANHEVVAHQRSYFELLQKDDSGATQIENKKFGDQTNGFIPEISDQFNAPRSGWLTLWTNSNELGRPIYHTAGFSPAYFPSWVISKFTENPWTFFTILTLLTCFFAGLFLILLCQELLLAPFAALIAGLLFTFSPYLMYWITFPMFASAWCWSACAMWSLTRLSRTKDWLSWVILTFSIYSLLMTAYPQLVIFHAYLLVGYGLYITFKQKNQDAAELKKFLLFSSSAVVIGIILTLPVMMDQ